MDGKRIFVITATYNERENIERLIKNCFDNLPDADLLVVDDDSPDGTGALVKKVQQDFHPRLHLIERKGKRGYGSAFVEGFRYALGQGATEIVSIDADFSHDPAMLPALTAATQDADIAVGSRYKDGVRILNWPFRRLLLSAFANFYVRKILNFKVSDATSGYRCYRSDALAQLDLKNISSQGYSFLVEVLYRCTVKGLTAVEVPIVFSERAGGKSKMSTRVFLEAVVRPILLKIRYWTRRL